MNVIKIILITILTSLYFFPFNSSFLPDVNTKLVLAVFAIVLYMFNNAMKQSLKIDKPMISVIVWSLAVSLFSFFSTLINDTNDYTYSFYTISVMVWIGGAYTVIESMRRCYGFVNIRLVTNFLILVCVCQCIISQLTDNYEPIADWVKSFVVSEGFMGIPKGRLYGIGCALDVAGLKFCTVLVLLSYFAIHPSEKINKNIEIILYLIAFIIISVLGSMISRTTAVGIGLAILLWIFYPTYDRLFNIPDKNEYNPFLKWLVLILMIVIPVFYYLYQTNESFHTNIRFGFEGFFSLVEQGAWKVRSNEQLAGMWVWPDNLRTWLIGDGYFNSPRNNPFYVGKDFIDYYMGTDIGYCRFIFYFGIIGLATICCFFINCSYQCSKKIPSCAICFWIIVFINFLGWSKVSSDIFPTFALLLLLNPESSQSEINEINQSYYISKNSF